MGDVIDRWRRGQGQLASRNRGRDKPREQKRPNAKTVKSQKVVTT
jgi:hypothetical protein